MLTEVYFQKEAGVAEAAPARFLSGEFIWEMGRSLLSYRVDERAVECAA